MISLTASIKKAPIHDPAAPPVSPARRQSNGEMERLRELILGETTERVDDITRQVTNRDARVRRLVEDMPEALNKHSSDQGSLTRLANALRIPIEEALNQSVKGDQQKLAEILAPALARALPRTLSAFLLCLPMALARRAFHVACPWARVTPTRAGGLATLGGHRVSPPDYPFQVDRVCLIEKGSLETLRSSDIGFEDDETELEVDHLFSQLVEALRSGSPNPTASLRYPRPKSKNEAQGIIVLETEHTLFAAYFKGQPAPWLRDRLQDLADEADRLAHEIHADAAPDEAAEPRLQMLDALLKKGLVCYVPVARPAAEAPSARQRSWLEDAAVITCVIGVVWLVAAVARATTAWNQSLQRLDREAGIVITDHSWIPGRSITGLRDPLAPDPAALLAARGYPVDSVKIHFTSFVSDEAPFKEQRASLQHAERDSVRREIASSYARALALMEASLEMRTPVGTSGDSASLPADESRAVIRKELLRTLLELPADAAFDFTNGVVTISASLPKATRSRIREVVKAIPWVKETKEATFPVNTTSRTSPAAGINAAAPQVR